MNLDLDYEAEDWGHDDCEVCEEAKRKSAESLRERVAHLEGLLKEHSCNYKQGHPLATTPCPICREVALIDKPLR